MRAFLSLAAVATLSVTCALMPAVSEACELRQEASPSASRGQAGIQFTNRTRHSMRVFWSDFEGKLKPFSGWIAPGDVVDGITTTVGHRWYVAIATPQGEVCAGPIWADYAYQTCDMLIFYDGRYGDDLSLSGAYCDFEMR